MAESGTVRVAVLTSPRFSNPHSTRVPAHKKLVMHRILLFLTLFLLGTSASLDAQSGRPLDIQVNFPPPFPREFTAYFNNPTAYDITVTNFTDQDQEVYFLAEMRGLTNGVLVQTRRDYRAAVSLMIAAGETVMLTGEDVANLNEGIQLSDLNISGLPGGPSINGILPEGMYQFCINAYDFNLDQVLPLSVGCGTLIDITYADQLTILHPAEDDVLLANPGGTFEMMWDPNESDPMRRMDIEYEVKMIDLTEYPDEDLDLLLRDGGPQVEFDENMITNEFYLYGAAGTDFELEFGHRYAMRVRRVDGEPVPLINDGYSEIRTFWYGEIPAPDTEDAEVDTPLNITDCVANCEYTEDLNQTRAANTTGVTSLEVGHFTMEDVVFTGGTTGPTWRGTGKIRLGGWMLNYPLAVTFNDLVINAENRVIGGEVKARDDSNNRYDLGDLHQRLDGLPVPDTIASIVNEHVLSLRMLDGLLTGDAQGMPVGIEEEIQGHKFTFALVGAVFTARGADVDLLTLVDLTSLSPNLLLPLGARGVCLTPGGLGSEATLLLTQDISTDLGTEMALSLSGSPRANMTRATNNACYIEFDCDGIKELAVRGKVAFPRSMVVPDNNGASVDTGRVKGLFEFTLDRNVPDSLSAYAYRAPEPDPGQPAAEEPPAGSHMMLGFEMTPFQIAGLEGWTFTVREATLDLSELENPAGMKFPKDYAYSENVDTGELWQGFLLKELSLATPRTMRADSQRTSIALTDIIIDPEPSLSMNALVLNIIDKSIGAMDGWGFSLDTFQLSIVQNTLIDGRIMGKLSTPLVGSADYLKYKAVINKNEEEQYVFNAIATPEKDSVIQLPMVLADAGICPNSFIQFRTSKDTTFLQAFLAGQMSVNVSDNLPDSLQAMNLVPDLSIKFAEFQLNFDNKNGFVTAGEAPIGTESMFGFAVDFQDELCGTNYNGPIFYDTDRPDYDYDVGDLNQIMHDGIPNNPPTPLGGDGTAPQEKVAGFPISIGDVDFAFEGTQVRVDLRIDLHLNGSENQELKGSATVGMASTLRRDGLKIKKFKIDSVYLSAVTVGTEQHPIDLDFMSLYGGVRFVNFSGGKGFQGNLAVTTGSGFGFDLKAGFGKAGNSEMGEYGTADYHGWWYLDGMFKFPRPGIPMGVAQMNGIGGGVYWNATAPSLTLSVAEVMAAADGATELDEPEIPQPAFGSRTIAFRTNMSLIRPAVMIVEPEIVASWTAGEGLNSLSLNGDFWALNRSEMVANMDGDAYKSYSRIWGGTDNTLLIERGESNRKFAVMGTNRIYANLINNVLYGAGEDRLMVQSAFYVGHKDLVADYEIGNISGNTYWFLNIGNPYEGNMGGLRFNLPGFNLDNAGDETEQLGENRPTASVGAGVDFYLMAGMNIPNTLPEPPGRITELFGLINREEGGGMAPSSREDEREDTESTVTGTGIVVGAHAFASAEVNAVLYARLAILAGLDFMAFHYPDGTGCITESGEEIPEIGVAGWYGTGRAYVGIEGIIGARGRFMGNEIDVRILHLAAAAMVEAGGPRPMYLNGRLGIYYSLLGGLIEGSARMKINVGQRCQPIGGSPFGFPIIVDSNPSDSNSDNVSASVKPKVSFSIPLTDRPGNPEYSKIVRVPDTEGNIHQRCAYVESFTVVPRGGGERDDYSRDDNYPFLIQNGRAAEYRPNGYLSAPYGVEEDRNWRMRLVVKVKEKLSNGNWVNVSGLGGHDYEEVREVDFTTNPMPETLEDSEVGMTKPFRFQHFYLQDDVGHRRAVVHTRRNLSGSYFSNNIGLINYQFDGVVLDAETGEEISRNPVTYSQNSRKAIFDLPQLDNDREFELAIIRRSTNELFATSRFTSRQTVKKVGTEAAYAAEEINSEYEVNAEVVNLSSLADLGPSENLIFKWNFRTSEFNTLEDKMNAAALSVERRGGRQRITIGGRFEGFDRFDILGKLFEFDTNTPDEERYVCDPLVEIADPFLSSFHTDQSIPLVGGFVSLYWNQYTNTPTGIYRQQNASVTIPDLNLGGQSIEGVNGGQVPSQGNGGTTVDVDGEVDLDWPTAPEYNHDINYLWSVERPYAALNEHVLLNGLRDNTPQGLANSGGNRSVRSEYYVTEKVLADAEGLTDFYEYWRDRILNPLDHTDNPLSLGEYVNVWSPDRRVENMADLEAKYQALVNSDLVRRPPLTILSPEDYEDEPDPPPLATTNDNWATASAGYTNNLASLFRSGNMTMGNLGSSSLGSSNDNELTAASSNRITLLQNDEDGYSDALERTRGLIGGRYGFSNQIRFRSVFPDTGNSLRTVVFKDLNN